jgi:glutamyl-tRNA synthetase
MFGSIDIAGSKKFWKRGCSSWEEKSDRKGKELFLPLRFALTGKTHGPEMKNLLPLISRKEVLSRLDV